MDLAVVVHSDHPHDGLAMPIAGEQHRAGSDARRVAGVGKSRPAEAVVILSVEIGSQVDVVFHGSFPQRGSLLMVRVLPKPVLAAPQPLDAIFEVVEGHGEVAAVPTGRVELKSG